MVSFEEVGLRELTLCCPDSTPKTVVKIQTSSNISRIGASLERLPAFIVQTEARHIPVIAKIDNNIRLDIKD
jgi:hypothetical protein